jgi:outer membrane biosynthesis protein TonB
MDEQTPPTEPVSTWGMRLRHVRPRPPRGALLASILLHGLAVGGLWAAGLKLRPDMPVFETYAVTLVSPPPAELGEPEPVVTNTPVVAEPEPPPPTPDPPKPKPKEQPRTQAPSQRPVEREAETKPAKGPDPKPVSISGEGMDVRIEGAEFPYPDYLQDMVASLMRIFRWNGSPNLEATVVFAIRRDGSVERGSIDLVRKSGNFNFDAATIAAVEQAGKTGAFDPLPEGLQGDRLWISFTFKPKRD